MRIDKARAAAIGVEFMEFTWPSPMLLTKRIGDYLDDNVPAKFYLSDMWNDRIVPFNDSGIACKLRSADGKVHQDGRVFKTSATICSLLATDYKKPLKVLVDE